MIESGMAFSGEIKLGVVFGMEERMMNCGFYTIPFFGMDLMYFRSCSCCYYLPAPAIKLCEANCQDTGVYG